MKQDMREYERKAEMAEMRYLQQKQESNAKIMESELKCDFAEQRLSKQSEELVKLNADGQIKQKELLSVKADLKAQMLLRDQIIQQLNVPIKV